MGSRGAGGSRVDIPIAAHQQGMRSYLSPNSGDRGEPPPKDEEKTKK